MVQAKLKNLRSGNNFEHRFRADDAVQRADMETHELQFLYKSGDSYHFMNTENYEQLEMDAEALGDDAPWVQDNMMVIVEFYNGKPMSVQLPQFMNFTIKDTAPVMKTATKTASSKPALLENGVTINVPEFIASGERVRVNPSTGEYMDRAKD